MYRHFISKQIQTFTIACTHLTDPFVTGLRIEFPLTINEILPIQLAANAHSNVLLSLSCWIQDQSVVLLISTYFLAMTIGWYLLDIPVSARVKSSLQHLFILVTGILFLIMFVCVHCFPLPKDPNGNKLFIKLFGLSLLVCYCLFVFQTSMYICAICMLFVIEYRIKSKI